MNDSVKEVLLGILKRNMSPKQYSEFRGPSVTLLELAEEVDRVVLKLEREIEDLC